jgi:nickel-dependent lactate racemase
MATFRFGAAAQCELPLEDYTLLSAASDEHPTLADPAAGVRAALAAPLGFPPLVAATAPGDVVAVALGDNVPQSNVVVRGVIEALLDAGVSPAMITIVSLQKIAEREALENALAARDAEGVKFELHDPDDEQTIAMVGVNSAKEPLRLNRTLAEADLVLPVSAQRLPEGGQRDESKFAGLFPQFSNRETAARVRLESGNESPKVQKRLRTEADEAGWLLGVQMTVSVVPGANGGVAAALAGDPDKVLQEAAELTRAIWEKSAAEQGDLAIAAVAGDEREQTWDNLARAVAAASLVVAPGGAIAVCSELETPPTGPLLRLREAVDFGEVLRELSRDEANEAHPALVLAKALEEGPVYLRSRLPSELVESLGMTAIESDAELARLAAGREHCIIIEEAQRLMPRPIVRDEWR